MILAASRDESGIGCRARRFCQIIFTWRSDVTWRNHRRKLSLGYLNNLAFARGMKAVFRFSYFAGTFSEYDLGVIPRA